METNQTPRSSPARAAVGREGFLEKAEQLFTERGYRAVSIRDIAQACEVSNAALYYHFPSKEALFREVMARHVTGLGRQMAAAGEAFPGPRARLEAMLVEYSRIAADHRSPFFLLRRDQELAEKAYFRELMSRWMQAMLKPLDETIQAAVQSGELRALPGDFSPAALLMGMLHGVVQHRMACAGGAAVGADDIALVVDVFWAGLRSQNAAPDSQGPAAPTTEIPVGADAPAIL